MADVKHLIVWAGSDDLVGCLCGYRSEDFREGRDLVKHFLAAGWEEGYEQAHEDEVSSGLYNYSPNPLVIDVVERTENPYA